MATGLGSEPVQKVLSSRSRKQDTFCTASLIPRVVGAGAFDGEELRLSGAPSISEDTSKPLLQFDVEAPARETDMRAVGAQAEYTPLSASAACGGLPFGL